MFDISQTEGEELPKLSEISGSAEDHLLYLESVYHTLNIKLETRPMPEGTHEAFRWVVTLSSRKDSIKP